MMNNNNNNNNMYIRRTMSQSTYYSPSPAAATTTNAATTTDAAANHQQLPKSHSIHFPTATTTTSPANVLLGGQQMHHFTHSHHPPITLLNLRDPFICSGCKESGAGNRFACHNCEFQLHDFCALSPPILQAHPFHPQHQLVFYSKPKTGGIRWPTCNVCGKSTKGFMFRCKSCHNFQMHPSCAMLSDQINYPFLHTHPLHLMPPNQDSSSLCTHCNRRRSGRLYGCSVCVYHVHAVCAKDMINGINTTPPPHKPNRVLGPAVRFASQAVTEFIGGLIDGIGEGVGEALVQDVTRTAPRPPAATTRI